MKYTIEFYSTATRIEPAKIFIEGLEPKMIAKLLRVIELLENNGPDVREPYSKYLREDIFEIRVKQGNNIVRVLYFFAIGGRIILTNGFLKKTVKTPKREFEKAKKYKNDYERRCCND